MAVRWYLKDEETGDFYNRYNFFHKDEPPIDHSPNSSDYHGFHTKKELKGMVENVGLPKGVVKYSYYKVGSNKDEPVQDGKTTDNFGIPINRGDLLFFPSFCWFDKIDEGFFIVKNILKTPAGSIKIICENNTFFKNDVVFSVVNKEIKKNIVEFRKERCGYDD